ncbi:hypothetical protein ANCCEY_08421 [Ancylostoma ceylanicum]|uniref:Uncharacterized protein n=1 Tax=Ancylostoma ceylanicum TaxID=53326 RepID=A0A0D6LK80_9BILA|nr:hypothetical protein ANCCEY_08421 [Ancylostoma ceylanicum]
MFATSTCHKSEVNYFFRRHSKILAYDWTRPGDADTVVEDIERLDFDFFEWHSGDVMEEWFTLVDEIGWNGWRQHVTSKVDARLYAFGGMSTHEVGELYINPRDAGHFMHVMRKEVLKSPHSYGFITKNGDPIQGLTNWRTDHYMAEPWLVHFFLGNSVSLQYSMFALPRYEYYYKEAYYDDMGSLETSLDPHSDSYDPDYVHHHH